MLWTGPLPIQSQTWFVRENRPKLCMRPGVPQEGQRALLAPWPTTKPLNEYEWYRDVGSWWL